MIRSEVLWWISFALCTSGWTTLLPLYYRVPSWIGMVLLGLAAMVGIAAAERGAEPIARRPRRTVAIVLAAAAIGAGILASSGMRVAFALAACGVLLAAFSTARRIARGLSAVGAIALAQGTAVGLYTVLLGDVHATPMLSFVDVWLFRALGRSVSAVGRTIYVATATGPVAVVPSWDQFMLVVGCIVLAGLAVLVLGSATRARRLCAFLRGAGIVVAFLIIRRTLLVLVALESGSPRLFWDPALTVVLIVPLVVLLALFSRIRPTRMGVGIQAALSSTGRQAIMTGACAFAATFLLLTALYIVPAGTQKAGSVLFDEAHGDWESTRTAMDTEVYGMATTYNYASLYDWLSYYYPVDHLTQPIDEHVLDECSVLVLKTPSSPYSLEEIEAVASFVRNGGGLFLIGDHTNVFGTTTVLNPVLEPFGMALNYDSTYRLETGSFTRFSSSYPYLDPIMQHVDRFDFLTSCSIRAPRSAYHTIADNRVLANQADYATRDFFPKERYNLRSEFGQFIQTAAVVHGAGRVVVFADSTCFSNFSVFMDGYPSFLLGTMAFLSHENVRVPFRGIALALMACSLVVLGVVLWRGRGAPGGAGILCGVLLGWAVFSAVACGVHRVSYPLPEPDDDIPFVYFDMEHSDIEIEPQPASSKTYDRSRQYDTFFVWTQRITQIPQLTDSRRRRAILPGRPYVVINPHPGVDVAFLEWIQEYVSAGGALILMDRCGRDNGGSDRLLAEFGLAVTAGCGSDRVIEDAAIETREISPSLTLRISVVPIESGHVVLVSDSSPFSNLSLGGAFVVPSTIQQALYDTVFWLFDGVVQRGA